MASVFLPQFLHPPPHFNIPSTSLVVVYGVGRVRVCRYTSMRRSKREFRIIIIGLKTIFKIDSPRRDSTPPPLIDRADALILLSLIDWT